MLVLTRKANEEILIGDNVRITLVRIQGGAVRIGIDAPREVRIVRGELERNDDESESHELSDREQAFAHPVANNSLPKNRIVETAAREPKVFVGSIRRSGEDAKLKPAPLAQFVAAS